MTSAARLPNQEQAQRPEAVDLSILSILSLVLAGSGRGPCRGLDFLQPMAASTAKTGCWAKAALSYDFEPLHQLQLCCCFADISGHDRLSSADPQR
ncbi:hypothetical protein BGZ61DRAFT_184591 [Ilyonectria robusta]|uniref:uncharacterized protein n=1 Tax=Ilyonectria robusta TaxID=1079257 RepID=UPI001E8D7540|nr:uncharacterized protein BGZ61DRAFT_184591 [Ilyonectria robusta]KAH8729591.1 hypothetical protein BGZ61DRAFT_184591 [Ilyonectria robusta]